MRVRSRSLVGAALAACLVLAGAGTAVAAPTSGTAPSSTAAAAAFAGRPASQPAQTTVALPTGDRVVVSSDATGRQQALVLPEDPAAHETYLTLRIHEHLYVVPRSALPRLAGGHDLGRFDVTALATGEPAQDLKGPSPRSRHFPMRTLRINGIDDLGQPAGFGMYVLLLNVDDGRKFAYFSALDTGYRKVAVPVGNYCAIGYFGLIRNGEVHDRIVTLPDFRVRKNADLTTITLDMRKADQPLSVSTPRPSTMRIMDVQIDRSDAAGTGDISLGYELTAPDQTVSVSPTERPVTHGELRFYHTWRTAADDGSYTYDLEFQSDGSIPAQSHYDVTDDQLAVVDARYDANATGQRGLEQRYSYLPWQTTSVRVGSGALFTPLHRTEYVMADPDIGWLQTITQVFSFFFTAGAMSDSYRRYLPGEQVTSHWNAPPIVPSVFADFGANPSGDPFVCPACRQGNTLSLLVYPFGDNQLGHVGARDGVRPGSPIQENTQFDVYRGSELIATAPQALGSVELPAEPGRYHLVYQNTRSAPWWTLSTDVHTQWSFTSSAADGTGTLPSGWLCTPGGGTDCGVVPLLFARYGLPTTDLGVVEPGGQTAHVTVTHLQGVPESATTLAVDASYDGGATWTPASVHSRGAGGYTVQLTVPPADQTDGYLALRVHAEDAAGSALDQTVLRAAAVGTAPDALAGPVRLDTPAAPAPASAGDAGAACSAPRQPHRARCFALVRDDAGEQRALAADEQPEGYGPADLRSAYDIASAAAERGAGQTIAVVAAYDDPNAEADLAVYREQYGLPPCTSASGCFRKLNQDGGTDEYPRPNYGWATEISLDLDMVSAACPLCDIVLVEADTNKISDLAEAVDTAAAAGADVVTNSYGTDEFTGMDEYAPHYRHPGTFTVVASGDDGFTVPQFPAVLPDVAAVGGTTLTPADNERGWTEQAWGHGDRSLLAGGAGSGCSGYVEKPAWQHDRDCLMRTTADVSAVGDPNTGVAVYDTVFRNGWIVVGGTSAAAPFVAGVIGLAGNAATLTPKRFYTSKHELNDVVGGSVGYCLDTYLCTGVKGYDGPTGMGTPRGIRAF